ncbi:UspA [Dillenia turbinata]|uniref:UspA n=1 Tax=Dillenia turbinata TaxID=194707 RepID=A0AAN8YUI1_9MAGN
MADAEVKERRILVAVDEGEESMYALSWCLNNLVCHRSKTTLILLYAKQPRVAYTAKFREGYLFSSDIIATMKGCNEVANGVIGKARKLCNDFRHDIKVETKVESGDPRDVICEMVEKLGPDLLIMGTHGYGLIKR